MSPAATPEPPPSAAVRRHDRRPAVRADGRGAADAERRRRRRRVDLDHDRRDRRHVPGGVRGAIGDLEAAVLGELHLVRVRLPRAAVDRVLGPGDAGAVAVPRVDLRLGAASYHVAPAASSGVSTVSTSRRLGVDLHRDRLAASPGCRRDPSSGTGRRGRPPCRPRPARPRRRATRRRRGGTRPSRRRSRRPRRRCRASRSTWRLYQPSSPSGSAGSTVARGDRRRQCRWGTRRCRRGWA